MSGDSDPSDGARPAAAEPRRGGWIGDQVRRAWAFLAEPPNEEPQPTPFFDRFCIAFLAVDWIVFGSMHFSHHEATARMIPEVAPWIVPWKGFLAIATGIVEVSIGVLAFYGRTRRTAAVVSIALLFLYLPSVYHILTDNRALPDQDPNSLASRLWRGLGVPHNALMLICSIHLLRRPYPARWRAELPDLARASPRTADHEAEKEPRPGKKQRNQGRAADRSFVESGWAVLLVALFLLLCNAAGLIALWLGVRGDRPTAYMWMMMCLAVGGLLGFLFAVPRAGGRGDSRASDGRGLRPNRNIEAISDWLTKILVGLGLVNFKEVGAFLADRAAMLAPILMVHES